MNVIIVGRAFPEKKTGMHGIFEFEQAVEIQKLGHEVTYLYCDIRSIKYQRRIRLNKSVVDGVKVYGYNVPLGGLPESVKNSVKSYLTSKLLEHVLNGKSIPDVVHVHFPLLTLDIKSLEIIKKFNVRLILTEHWTYVSDRRLSVNHVIILNSLSELAERIICVSEQLKDSFSNYLSNKKNIEKLCVLPNIVREDYQWNGTDIQRLSFLFAGRLEPVKRCDILIDAFEKAFPIKQYKEAKLIIAGNGTQFKELKEKCKTYNDSRIEFAGYVDRVHMIDMYNQCKVYVSASELETFGVPFAEAWCCGKPIICADNSPIIPYLREGENGFSFKKNNVDDLAQKLKQISRDEVSMSALEIEKYAYSHFSAESVIKKIEQIYMEAQDK